MLLAYSYTLASPAAEKTLAADLATALMRAMTLLGEHAARLPTGPSNPECRAGVSFWLYGTLPLCQPALEPERSLSSASMNSRGL